MIHFLSTKKLTYRSFLKTNSKRSKISRVSKTLHDPSSLLGSTQSAHFSRSVLVATSAKRSYVWSEHKFFS